jgi:hypothetical protein
LRRRCPADQDGVTDRDAAWLDDRAVDAEAALALAAGQAIESKAEHEQLHATNTVSESDPSPPDPEQYLASAAQLMQLQPRRVHFSHDTAVWGP